jgi:hypothetical protein
MLVLNDGHEGLGLEKSNAPHAEQSTSCCTPTEHVNHCSHFQDERVFSANLKGLGGIRSALIFLKNIFHGHGQENIRLIGPILSCRSVFTQFHNF